MKFKDEMIGDLRALISADFGREMADTPTDDELFSWLHYRARLIPMRPRKVIWSASAKAAAVRLPAVGRIADVLEAGGDVSPWLSNSVRKRKDDSQADLLFNDWQISHFHTSEVFSTPNTIRRGDELLFAFVKANHAVLLDVLPHRDAWTDQRLVRTLRITNPSDLVEVKGVSPPPEPIDEYALKYLRDARMTGFIVLDDSVYMPPGFGLTGGGTATRIIIFASKLLSTLENVRKAVRENHPSISGPIAGQIGLPVILGIRFQGGLFTIYEKSRHYAISSIGPLE